MATLIHPTAIVDPAAQIADGVEIGAYSIIGPNVEIGAGTALVLDGSTPTNGAAGVLIVEGQLDAQIMVKKT